MITYVIPDLHGEIKALDTILNYIGYEPNQMKLIFLGDFVDRGFSSKEVIEKVIKLQKEADEGNVVTLMGNHDQWFKEFLEGTIEEMDFVAWYRHGGKDTLESYHDGDFNLEFIKNYIVTNYKEHLEWLQSLKTYHEDDHFYYAHAGCDFTKSNIAEHHEDTLVWTNRNLFFHEKSPLDKPIVVGHTPVYTIYNHEKREPFVDMDLKKIGIDGGYVFGKDLFLMEIKNDGTFEITKVL